MNFKNNLQINLSLSLLLVLTFNLSQGTMDRINGNPMDIVIDKHKGFDPCVQILRFQSIKPSNNYHQVIITLEQIIKCQHLLFGQIVNCTINGINYSDVYFNKDDTKENSICLDWNISTEIVLVILSVYLTIVLLHSYGIITWNKCQYLVLKCCLCFRRHKQTPHQTGTYPPKDIHRDVNQLENGSIIQ